MDELILDFLTSNFFYIVVRNRKAAWVEKNIVILAWKQQGK